MKKLLMTCSALALLAMAAPAAADDYNYVGLGVGYGQVDDNSASIGPATDRVNFDDDALGNITLGHAFESGLRVEFEVPYRQNDFDTSASGASGRVKNYGALVNLIYDFNKNGAFQPYVGAGVGYGRTEVKLNGNTLGGLVDVNDSNDGLIAQGLLGVGFKITDSLMADIGYRYFYAENADSYDGVNLNDNYTRNDGLIGIRYTFGATRSSYADDTPPAPTQEAYPPPPAPLPPAPVAPPPPPPAPSCPGGEATVYFDLGRSDVDGQNQNVLQQLVALRTPNTCTATFAVVGYTDTSGSPAANRRLAQRRADRVRQALIDAGVPAAEIRTEALGENDPAVTTGDGVKEERNRRVVVTMTSTAMPGAAGQTTTSSSSPYGDTTTGATGATAQPYGTTTSNTPYGATTTTPGTTAPAGTNAYGATTSPYAPTAPSGNAYTAPGTTSPSATAPYNTTTTPYAPAAPSGSAYSTSPPPSSTTTSPSTTSPYDATPSTTTTPPATTPDTTTPPTTTPDTTTSPDGTSPNTTSPNTSPPGTGDATTPSSSSTTMPPVASNDTPIG